MLCTGLHDADWNMDKGGSVLRWQAMMPGKGSSEMRMTCTGLAEVSLCAAGAGSGQNADPGSAPADNGGSGGVAPAAGVRLYIRASLCTIVHTSQLQPGCRVCGPTTAMASPEEDAMLPRHVAQ